MTPGSVVTAKADNVAAARVGLLGLSSGRCFGESS